MRRSMPARTASLTAAALMAAALLATPAWADDGFGGPTSTQGAGQHGGTYVPQVTVTVTVNGTRTSTAAVTPAATQYAHPPCWYEPSWTGPDRARYYDSGEAARDAHHHGDPELADPPPGYADHKNDGPDKGMFWSAVCSSEYWNGDDIHAFTDYAEQWINGHPTIWVANGAPNPNTQIVIPPRVLMEIARNALHPGAPTLEVNPQAHSVVNLPTWVWATDDTFVRIQATAAFNGNWATVIATPGGLRLSTNGPADVNSTCTGGGEPWTRGATDSDCTVTYRKSTAGGGSYTISASIDWQVHWEGSGGQNEALPPPPNAPIGNRVVQVDEVQTVVNGH